MLRAFLGHRSNRCPEIMSFTLNIDLTTSPALDVLVKYSC